jgi:hypothetical protein
MIPLVLYPDPEAVGFAEGVFCTLVAMGTLGGALWLLGRVLR